MSKISFVYFDVGGVVIKDFSDTDKWTQMLEFMGLGKHPRVEIDKVLEEFGVEVITGKRSVDSLLPIYHERFGISVLPDFSMLEHFVANFEHNKPIWPLIEKIKQTVKIGLLTDQYIGMLSLVIKKGLFPPVEWDQIVDSTVVGYKKPMPEIYELAEKLAGVPAEEILFIDNREKNLVPARERGWQTFLYDSKNYDQANRDLTAYLKNIL